MTGYSTNKKKKRGASKWFYDTSKWKKSRDQAYERDEGRCVKCGKLLAGVREYNVDHIVSITDYSSDELKYDLSNLQTLCIPCHNNKRNTEIIDEAKHNTNQINNIFDKILEAN